MNELWCVWQRDILIRLSLLNTSWKLIDSAGSVVGNVLLTTLIENSLVIYTACQSSPHTQKGRSQLSSKTSLNTLGSKGFDHNCLAVRSRSLLGHWFSRTSILQSRLSSKQASIFSAAALPHGRAWRIVDKGLLVSNTHKYFALRFHSFIRQLRG